MDAPSGHNRIVTGGRSGIERTLLYFRQIMRDPLVSESFDGEDEQPTASGGLSLDELDTELTRYLEYLQSSISTDTILSTPSYGSNSNDQEEKKKEPMRKHDIRRYFSTMFFNVLNCTEFEDILSYFETFMHATAPLDIVYYSAPLESSSNTVHHLRVEGPHTSSYYIMCLGALFPDMVTVCKSGRIITSTTQVGCKLVLEATLQSTKLGNLSIDVGLHQFAALYDEYRRLMFMFPYSHLSMSSTDSEGSPSNRRRNEGKAPRRSIPNPNVVLQTKVHDFVSHTPQLPEPLPMLIKCTYVLMLDERNHINSISVTAVREV